MLPRRDKPQALPQPLMNKNTFKTVKLAKGEANVYDFGAVKLHAYKTNDPISDEVFIAEKNGKAVVIEPPCFFDNCRELAEYLAPLAVEGVLVAYHGAGASFLYFLLKFIWKLKRFSLSLILSYHTLFVL